MGGNHSRNKGAEGERAVVQLYRDAGMNARRNFGSGSQGGGDITGQIPDVPEVKRTAKTVKFHDWVAQAREGARTVGKPWALWIRVDHDDWTVTVPHEHYIGLLVAYNDLVEQVFGGDE